MRPVSVPFASRAFFVSQVDQQAGNSNQALIREPLTISALEANSPLAHADSEVVSAWRLLAFNWKFLACIAGIVLAWLVATRFYVEPSGYLAAFAFAALCSWSALRNARSATPPNPRVFFTLTALAQMTLAVPVMLTLTYVATSISFPLQDAQLLAWDRALGFDFRRFLDFINNHPELIPVLARSYNSISLQMTLLVLLLPLAGCYRRSAEAICAYGFALFATTCISVFVPAIGVYDVLGLGPADLPYFEPMGYYDTLRDAPLVRAGALLELRLTQLVGIVTFPSFHAAAAILYMWSFWPFRWLRLLSVPWNILMIVATPLGGGHYLVDILAGISVATAAIMATRAISTACSSGRLELMSATRLPIAPPA
ncbi:phosphatase PAP2 family protein [Bradyrhizobium genosp. A]|uniref:phosphatase PAP2 family protein n=1 Tax=Bradyrhizobium genosp. A TaxID=83626 RepID=UPI003CF1C7E4